MKRLLHLLCVGISLSLSCNNTNPPSKQSSPEKKDIANQGVKIAYTDTGNGDTTLVFVHGWGINKGYWSDQVSAFSNRYRVVPLDLPGFGQSGKNRDGMEYGDIRRRYRQCTVSTGFEKGDPGGPFDGG